MNSLKTLLILGEKSYNLKCSKMAEVVQIMRIENYCSLIVEVDNIILFIDG